MSAQHTPGPWKVSPPCKLSSRYSVYHNGPVVYVDRGEDARLIAAAPDLLAALQMVNRIWSHDQTANLAPDSPVAIVRAAIAKATGGAA